MSLTRMRDGVPVPLSEEEEAAVLAEWAAWTPPVPVDQADLDQIDKRMKALALCIAQVGNLTVPQMKALFRQQWDALP